MEQYSLDWYKARLGRVNGSECSAAVAGTSAKWSLICKVAIEQLVKERGFADEELQQYIDETEVVSRATDWGHANEGEAKSLYAIEAGVEVLEVGSRTYVDDEGNDTGLSASADGIVRDGEESYAIEVKCPYQPHRFFALAIALSNDPGDGSALPPEYRWQCVAECLCCGVESVEFIVFDPRIDELRHKRIHPTEADKQKLLDGVKSIMQQVKEVKERFRGFEEKQHSLS